MTSAKQCSICALPMRPAFDATLLGSHDVTYFICESCELIQTESPYWLEEAYSEAIARTDTGLVARNIDNRDFLEPVLQVMLGAEGSYVDLGGGYGLLTRLLRDIGIDCYSTDPYCENIFAKDFEATAELRPNALFAFEVMEHIENPLAFIRESFERFHCDTFIFSTLDYGESVPSPDWWYYAIETGQHISFYNQRTLAALARKISCRYLKLSDEYHMFTSRELSDKTVSLFTEKKKFRKLKERVRRERRRMSFTLSDYDKARQSLVK